MMYTLKIKIVLLFLLFGILVKAQDPNQKGNLTEYYYQKLHFGFALGLHQATFNIDPVEHLERFDTLKRFEVNPQFGFNLGIVSEYAFRRYVTVRFVPNISFSERSIDYVFEGYENQTYIKKIESTFLNFPVDLKLRSRRVKNFGAYILGGGAYNLDLVSKKNQNEDISPVLSQQTVKLKRDDFSYEIGVGTEFYLMYFKFAIEGKLSIGTNNMLIKENTVFSNPINKLNSKMFLISLTFEG